MRKTVLDIGNCGPDHAAIAAMLRRWFDVELLQADAWQDAVVLMQSRPIDLVFVNRKLDIDYSDGMEIIRKMKADQQWSAIPVMLVTNYAEHQQVAVDAGAEMGFGKLQMSAEETRARLERFIGAQVASGGGV